MEVVRETVGPFAENSYIVFDPVSRQAVAIDPGDESERILDAIRERDLSVRYILNTHGHLDHLGAVADVREATGAPFYIHRDDLPFVEALPQQAAHFGLPSPRVPEVDGFLEEGQVFELGEPPISIRVTRTPGHSPGSVSLILGTVVFSGDALFEGSIGRTDLPGGDLETLLASIRQKLLVLPDDTLVYPGHGDATTVGRERKWNPFLR